MAESSIAVAIRVRPFSAKERAQLAPHDSYQPFLGDGGLSGGSPSKNGITTVSGSASTGPGLRSKYLRKIVAPVDDKVLIFDPPEQNPYAAASSSSTQNTYAHGTRKARDVRYAFDRVFDDTCGQEMVFENTTKPLLDGILNGFNASVFAYGATGCGKTHTISGTPSDPGVIFLTMRELYKRIEESRDESDVHVRLSYLEIYNEQIRDLLSPTPTPPGAGLMLREDAANKISVVGITEHAPESPENVLEMIQEGNQRRTMSPTEANAVSSRSHAVLQINITQRPRTADTVMETTSASLNIIDLAGSERAAATRNDGARMKEGANINKSLLALGNCINALCQSGSQRARHIPYRNSKLTRLLKFSLGGNCKTVMIVCVSPSSAHYDETYNTLKYANQAKNIRTKVSRNMLNVDRHVAQYVQAIHELKEEVAELKAKLADRAALESAAEKRRKTEMAQEAQDCRAKMRKSTDDVKTVVAQKAGLVALFMAANARLASLRQRLEQIDEEMDKGVSHADVESEKSILRKLIARQEAILADRTMQNDVQSLDNTIQALRGVLMAASTNAKFDEETTGTIRIVGDAMMAEVEACKSAVVSETMSRQLSAGMAVLADFAVLGARSTLALKEAANGVESTTSNEKQVDGVSGVNALPKHLRSVARMNDDLFTRHIGLQTAEASSRSGEQSVNVLQRMARISHVGQTQPSAPPPVVGQTQVRLAKRASRSSIMPSAASALLGGVGGVNGKAPRRPSASLRRTSVGTRRVSSASRRTSQTLASEQQMGGAQDLTIAPKKSFRWADEAGEGKIENEADKKNMVAGQPASARLSTGPSRSIRHSLSTSMMGRALVRPDAMGGASNSSAEWEDLSKESGGQAPGVSIDASNVVRKEVPLSTSTMANTAASATVTKANVEGKKREGHSAMFGRNFLRKKKSESTNDTDSMDTDASTDDVSFTTATRPMPPLDGHGKSKEDVPSSDLSLPLSDKVATAAQAAHSPTTVRSSPYRRPSDSARDNVGSGVGGVGPIRTTKSRGSGGSGPHSEHQATVVRKFNAPMGGVGGAKTVRSATAQKVRQ